MAIMARRPLFSSLDCSKHTIESVLRRFIPAMRITRHTLPHLFMSTEQACNTDGSCACLTSSAAGDSTFEL